MRPNELRGCPVRGQQITGKDPGDLLMAVECHIEQEGGVSRHRHVPDLLPQWVALSDGPGGLRVRQHGSSVVVQNRIDVRDAR